MFSVGQRVRLARPERRPDMRGALGTVTGKNQFDGDICVAYDKWGDCQSPHYQLDPATDDRETCSWDECEWKPEHLTVGA